MSDLVDLSLTLRNSQTNALTTTQHDVNLFSIEEAVNAINAHLNKLQVSALAYINTNQTINLTATGANNWARLPNVTLAQNTRMNFTNNSFVPQANGNVRLSAHLGLACPNNVILEAAFGIAANNVDRTYFAVRKFTSADVGAMAFEAARAALAGQEIGLYVRDTNGILGNITIVSAQITIKGTAD